MDEFPDPYKRSSRASFALLAILVLWATALILVQQASE